MSTHNKIVKNLKERLRSKGYKILPFPKEETWIAQIGPLLTSRTIKHTEFKPDIIMSINEKPEDRFFMEYVHTERRYVYDLRGMRDLKQRIKKARNFILIINDSFYKPLMGIKAEVDRMSLNTFLNALNKYSQEEFLSYLEG